MKNKIYAILIASLLTACDYVPAGNVGVKFNLYGGDKGVQEEIVPPGKYWLGWNEKMFIYPTFTQNYVWTKDRTESSPDDESISFQTKEGLVVNADVGISYRIDPKKVSLIFQKYRKGVEEITDIYLRNLVRDAIVKTSSKMAIESVYGAGKITLIEEAIKDVKTYVEENGIIIEKIYWVGEFRLPETVVNTINKKIEATQVSLQRDIEVQTAIAEAKKQKEQALGEAEAIRIKSEAEANANMLVTKSVTDTLIEYEKVKKWNGILPQVTGNSSSLIKLD